MEPTFRIAVIQQEMHILRALDDVVGAKRVASILLDLTDPERLTPDPELAMAIGTMRKTAREYLKLFSPDPFRNYGRNDRVTVKSRANSRTWTAKFKHVESDLRSGRVVIFDDGPDE